MRSLTALALALVALGATAGAAEAPPEWGCADAFLFDGAQSAGPLLLRMREACTDSLGTYQVLDAARGLTFVGTTLAPPGASWSLYYGCNDPVTAPFRYFGEHGSVPEDAEIVVPLRALVACVWFEAVLLVDGEPRGSLVAEWVVR